MTSLSIVERRNLENFLGMSSGYVLNFSDRTFGEFVFEAVGIDIHAEKYRAGGTSKANKLRTLCGWSPTIRSGDCSWHWLNMRRR